MQIKIPNLLCHCGVLLLLSLLIGCSRNDSPPVPIKPQTFKVCMGGILATLPIIAQEKGFFQAEGIAAEISLLGDGKAAMANFIDGKCDACLSGEFPVVRQSFDRNDLVIIATVASSDNAVKVLARRDRGIAAPADLTGKRIGVSKGTISNFFLDQFLKKNRLQRNKLTIIDISHSDLPEALKRGDIDAYAGSDFAYLRGIQAIGGLGITFTEPGLTNHTACLTVKKEWLAANQGTAHQVVRALVKAEQELALHPEELTALLAKRLNTPQADLQSIMGEQHNRVILDQVLLLALEDEGRWMLEMNIVNGKPLPNYLHFLDTTVLKGVIPAAVMLK